MIKEICENFLCVILSFRMMLQGLFNFLNLMSIPSLSTGNKAKGESEGEKMLNKTPERALKAT